MKTQKSVKIIQILQDVDPQGFYDLWGLGDDGALHGINWEKAQWKLCIGRNFAPEPIKESSDE